VALHILIGNFILFALLCFFGLVSFLGDHGSMRVSVTASEITVQNGFFYWSQTISYNNITDIVFKNSTRLERVQPDNKQTFGSKGLRFVINKRNGDYFIVQSVHAQEILDAIKKAHPRVTVD